MDCFAEGFWHRLLQGQLVPISCVSSDCLLNCLKAHSLMISIYHDCGDRGIVSKASYTGSCSGTGNISTGRILGQASKN